MKSNNRVEIFHANELARAGRRELKVLNSLALFDLSKAMNERKGVGVTRGSLLSFHKIFTESFDSLFCQTPSSTRQTSNATAYRTRTIIPYEIMKTPVCGQELVPPEFRIMSPIIPMSRNRIFSNYQESQRWTKSPVLFDNKSILYYPV